MLQLLPSILLNILRSSYNFLVPSCPLPSHFRLLQASPTSEQFPNGSSINTSLRGSSYFSLSLFRSHPPVRDDDLNRSLPPPLQRGKHHNRLILQISIIFAFYFYSNGQAKRHVAAYESLLAQCKALSLVIDTSALHYQVRELQSSFTATL